MSGAVAAVLPSETYSKSATAKGNSEFYELRCYTLKNEAQQKIVEDYYEKAAIPALNKMGIKNIGVFTELKPVAQSKLYVFIPYKSIENFVGLSDKLQSDSVYATHGAAYLNAPASEPAYERIESSLFKAFAHMPKMEVPAAQPRIFELRQYQSASESAGKKKIEMFNDKGEIDIFKKLGFKPVFFGEAMIGEAMPNLTYMVTFDDMAAHDQHWKSFGGDPEWKIISKIPEYADALLVSVFGRS
ncbi:MAG: family containing protein [Daejeonella sp.]|nr:family containing protein [Daejeonella sp.]